MANEGIVRLSVFPGVFAVMAPWKVAPFRIHREADANFGFGLRWWDRIFGTSIAQPGKGHDGMTIGLKEFRDERPTRRGWSLLLPLRDRRGNS